MGEWVAPLSQFYEEVGAMLTGCRNCCYHPYDIFHPLTHYELVVSAQKFRDSFVSKKSSEIFVSSSW